MPELVSQWTSNGLTNGQLRAFTNVLQGNSALLAATQATGGTVMPVDFRPYSLPVVADTTLPSKVTENENKPVVESTKSSATLQVDMYAKFKQFSRQLEADMSGSGIVSAIMDSVSGQYPIAFDVEHLADIVGGASVDSQEYDAANPVASISALLANYDATSFAPDAVILTRQGARKLRYALDDQERLQSPNGIAGWFDLPTFTTLATGAQLGVATVMAIVGPFGAGYWGNALGVSIERMPQATVDSKGPEQNIVNYRTEAAMGYANGIDTGDNGNGFAILIDAS